MASLLNPPSVRLLLALLTALLLLPTRAEPEPTPREGVVLSVWNLQNYAPLPEAHRPKPSKSEASAEAVATILSRIKPDLLALCEIGSEHQLADLTQRLAAHGLHYPHTELLHAADADRRLALLSRYPFASRQSLGDVPLDINGVHEKMRRGILDVTVTIPNGQPLRILGIHLKSKLELRDENEALLRRTEAYRLRQHLDQILSSAPTTRLLLYGDFNDTRDQLPIRAISGERGTPLALTALPLADDRGDRWTHHWAAADIYARIDFIMVSRSLRKDVDLQRSHIHYSPGWDKASDHRPLVVVFKPTAF